MVSNSNVKEQFTVIYRADNILSSININNDVRSTSKQQSQYDISSC
jgi:hypothetical protein